MKAIEKFGELIRWLDDEGKYLNRTLLKHKLISLFSDPDEKPSAPTSLVGEINELACELMRENKGNVHLGQALLKMTERYQPTESLAELADRKGRQIKWMAKRSEGIWEIWFNDDHDDFIGHTYSEAESKARQFLNSLPDKGDK